MSQQASETLVALAKTVFAVPVLWVGVLFLWFEQLCCLWMGCSQGAGTVVRSGSHLSPGQAQGSSPL